MCAGVTQHRRGGRGGARRGGHATALITPWQQHQSKLLHGNVKSVVASMLISMAASAPQDGLSAAVVG